MALLHAPAVKSDLERRLKSLTTDVQRRWGRMTIDQMLHHVNIGLASALGDVDLPAQKSPLPVPRALLKFLVLHVPWPKGAPTLRGLEVTEHYDFESERSRCLELVHRFTARRPADPWPPHPIYGVIPGAEVSALHAKHLDHHLRQFGA